MEALGQEKKGRPMGAQGEQILENIIQLAELLDDEALHQMPEVRFLELAKAVSFRKKKTGPSQPSSRRQKKGVFRNEEKAAP